MVKRDPPTNPPPPPPPPPVPPAPPRWPCRSVTSTYCTRRWSRISPTTTSKSTPSRATTACSSHQVAPPSSPTPTPHRSRLVSVGLRRVYLSPPLPPAWWRCVVLCGRTFEKEYFFIFAWSDIWKRVHGSLLFVWSDIRKRVGGSLYLCGRTFEEGHTDYRSLLFAWSDIQNRVCGYFYSCGRTFGKWYTYLYFRVVGRLKKGIRLFIITSRAFGRWEAKIRIFIFYSNAETSISETRGI